MMLTLDFEAVCVGDEFAELSDELDEDVDFFSGGSVSLFTVELNLPKVFELDLWNVTGRLLNVDSFSFGTDDVDDTDDI